MHFDTKHNVFMQIHGQKRFLLANSSDWAKLHMFPATHPGARQSQIPIRDFLSRLDGKNTLPFATQALTLSPGDVLFIPSCMFHFVQVLNETPSISANLYLSMKDDPGNDAAQMMQIATAGLAHALNAAESDTEHIYITQHYILQFLEHALGSIKQATAFVQLLLHSRFSVSKSFHDPMLRNPATVLKRSVVDLGCTSFQEKNHVQHWPGTAKATTFFRKLPFDMAQMVLADAVERLAAEAVGVEHTAAFLDQCI